MKAGFVVCKQASNCLQLLCFSAFHVFVFGGGV